MPMSPLQPNSSSLVGPSEACHEFSAGERTVLLCLAHDSISAGLQRREISLDAPSAHLAEPRGVFTSLYLCKDFPGEFPGENQRREVLRGCVGYVLPAYSVYRAVAETALAAAFDDNRFSPVTAEEAPHLEVELSILSPIQPIQPEEIEIGRHGLLISWQGRRGLLLPQVSVEHNWDRTTFLEQTCRKAGLPLDAGQRGATIEGFTADVFGDRDQGQGARD
jgi:AmmeMemoRadiSam system protein A